MADPIIQDVYRVQAILEHASALPEDRSVNSFAFARIGTATDEETWVAELANQLRLFYDEWANWRPSGIVDNTLTVKAYHLGDPPPREPLESVQTLIAGNAGTAYPEEVAVCLSFFGARNLPRTRGRVYLGPLTASAGIMSGGRVRVQDTLIAAIKDAALLLMDATFAATHAWGIVSQANADFVQIQQGWIDDAFDTQRRRGPDAQARTTWDFTEVGP